MSHDTIIQELKDAITSYPDFPKKGVIFRDFLPLFGNPNLFEGMLSVFENYLLQHTQGIDYIAGLESRGFLIGPSLALKLKIPFIAIRKPGKLPGPVEKESYALEYGSDTIEIQRNAVKKNEKVVIIDDLLATGGTMEAAVKLIQKLGGIVIQCLVVVELNDLQGRDKIQAPIYSIVQF